MPADHLHDAIEVLLHLPRETALADPRLADERDETCTALATRGVELLLQEPELVRATDEWRL